MRVNGCGLDAQHIESLRGNIDGGEWLLGSALLIAICPYAFSGFLSERSNNGVHSSELQDYAVSGGYLQQAAFLGPQVDNTQGEVPGPRIREAQYSRLPVHVFDDQ